MHPRLPMTLPHYQIAPVSPLMTIRRFLPSLPWGELMVGALALMLLTGM